MLRTLAHGCSYTALALAMHTHPLAMVVRRWNEGVKTAEPFLRRVAEEELVIIKEGTVEVNIDGRKYMAGPGAIVYFGVNETENSRPTNAQAPTRAFHRATRSNSRVGTSNKRRPGPTDSLAVMFQTPTNNASSLETPMW